MIRCVTLEDAVAIQKNYSYYVENTAITFEYEVPTVDEFKNRISKTLKFYPYLVYEEDGVILGYAYASPFKERAAYDWDIETSIYIKNGFQKKGIGKLLHEELKQELKKMGILTMYACIAAPNKEDEHLNSNSIDFHTHIGYKMCGRFSMCGYKFNTWYDMVWMEYFISEHCDNVKHPTSYNANR